MLDAVRTGLELAFVLKSLRGLRALTEAGNANHSHPRRLAWRLIPVRRAVTDDWDRGVPDVCERCERSYETIKECGILGDGCWCARSHSVNGVGDVCIRSDTHVEWRDDGNRTDERRMRKG